MIRWLRRHPNVVSLLLIVAVAAAGLWNAQRQHDELCEKVEEHRALLAALVDTAIDDDGDGGGLQLTALPEFQALDDETQRYLEALEARSRQGGDAGSSTEDRLREFRATYLAPAECD